MPAKPRTAAGYALLASMDALAPEDIQARSRIKDISAQVLDQIGESRVLATCCHCLTEQWAHPGWPAVCGFCGEQYSRRIPASPGSTS